MSNTPIFITQSSSQSNLTGSASANTINEITQGLLAPAASIAPKYFYDLLGSKLFEAITLTGEYYPTRTEAAIFQAYNGGIAQAIVNSGIQQACLIDLGAGNCTKAAALIPHLKPSQYVPIDISVDFLRDAASQVQASFPELNIVSLGMDFSSTLALPNTVQSRNRVFFYPGSSLGNFTPSDALRFLQQIASADQGNASGLLLGIDLVKDSAVLEAAYDDAAGVTSAFNKNMLLHINALLGSDFNLRQWQHVALFDAQESRIEMHLQALGDTTVRWPGHERSFQSGDRIHTENSYKYTTEGISELLKQAGFNQVQHWADPKSWFGVFWASKTS